VSGKRWGGVDRRGGGENENRSLGGSSEDDVIFVGLRHCEINMVLTNRPVISVRYFCAGSGSERHR
jgi:hypothetical protein